MEYNNITLNDRRLYRKMERASDIFRKIMLGILLLIMSAALLLTAVNGLTQHSYLIALLAGAVWAFILYRLCAHGKLRTLASVDTGKTALLLTLLCAAVNLAWVLAVRIEPFSDYETYWRTACALAFGREVDAPWYIAMYPHILGCSTFLSAFLKIFGEYVMVAAVINVILTFLSGLLIYGICLRLASPLTAALAYLLWIVCPSKLMLDPLVFSEPLYTCLILLFFYLIVLIEQRRGSLPRRLGVCLLWGLALGVLLRAVNIVRPISAILVIALVLWLLFLRGRDIKNGAQWKMWLVILVALFGIYKATGELWDRHVENVLGMEPASFPVYNIYVGFNEETQGQWSAEDMDLLFSYLSRPGATTSQAQKEMLPHLKERLSSGIDFGRLFASKLMAFMGNDELGGYTYRFTRPELFVKLCMVICNVFYYGCMLLALRGIFVLRRSSRLSACLLPPLYMLGLTLAHMLVEVSSRYHYSLIPVIIILAAFALGGSEKSRRSA